MGYTTDFPVWVLHHSFDGKPAVFYKKDKLENFTEYKWVSCEVPEVPTPKKYIITTAVEFSMVANDKQEVRDTFRSLILTMSNNKIQITGVGEFSVDESK